MGMHARILCKLFFLSLLVVAPCFGQQPVQQDISKAEFQSICAQSGGEFRENSAGYACCWSNWGCYNCQNGTCSMHCWTQSCSDANNAHLGPPQPRRPIPEGMKGSPTESTNPTGSTRPKPPKAAPEKYERPR